jgi:hypothetical protein
MVNATTAAGLRPGSEDTTRRLPAGLDRTAAPVPPGPSPFPAPDGAADGAVLRDRGEPRAIAHTAAGLVRERVGALVDQGSSSSSSRAWDQEEDGDG